MTCPRCHAPRVDAPDCPRCGVIYERAQAPELDIASLLVPIAEPVFEPEQAWSGQVDDARYERQIRLFALPVALVVAKLAMMSDTLHFLSRTFLSMWIHELGHATTAWFAGYGAFPGPWFTRISSERMFLVPVFLAGGLGYLGLRGHRAGKPMVVGIAVLLFVVQLVLTFGVKAKTAQMIFIFGGDAGALIWGTVLMSTMYASADSKLRRGALRWGFLVIGAITFMDVFDTWWTAHGNFDAIPYGRNEGVGLSDASRLSEDFGWSSRQIVNRFLTVAGVCGVALVGVYAWGIAAAVKAR